MIPLALGVIGQEYKIVKIGGSAEVKHNLADLGFVCWWICYSCLRSRWKSNCKCERNTYCIGKEMAMKVMI